MANKYGLVGVSVAVLALAALPAMAQTAPDPETSSVEDLVDAAKSGLHAGVTILVKGSRSNRLERVADALANGCAETGMGSH